MEKVYIRRHHVVPRLTCRAADLQIGIALVVTVIEDIIRENYRLSPLMAEPALSSSSCEGFLPGYS